MSLKIRLSRGGAKKRPYYHIVVADARKPRDGSFIERVGSYNPMVAKDHPDRVVLKEERIKYWMGVGGKPTDRVARFLAHAGMMEKPKVAEQSKQHLPRPKTLERMKEAEEKAAAKVEAAQEAKKEAEAAAAEAEAKPEEAKPEEKAEEAAPAEVTPAEESPAQETPAEESPAQETPAEESPAQETPAEDEEKKEDA